MSAALESWDLGSGASRDSNGASDGKPDSGGAVWLIA